LALPTAYAQVAPKLDKAREVVEAILQERNTRKIELAKVRGVLVEFNCKFVDDLVRGFAVMW
jgi:hypothetical protein